MRQHARFKKQHPDCVLMFRMGDFYELFDDDAVLVSKVLGLTLTERTAGVPMAGVPHHALDGYLARLIEQGYRVAVCDQIQDPAEAKGVVDRAVTRVVTPGTLVDEALLDDAQQNLLAAILFTEAGDESDAVAAMVEVSTGRFTLTDLPADRVVDELARIGPSELLYVETADGAVPPRVEAVKKAVGCAVTARPGWTFRHQDATDLLLDHFGVRTLSGFGLDDDDPALGPAGALVSYLRETQAPASENGIDRLGHLAPPKRTTGEGHLIIDAASFRSLEIERTMRTGQTEGSVLSMLQRCVTPMGKRLLRHWLCFPLRDKARIERRHHAVGACVDDRAFTESLRDTFGGVQDVARINSRVSLRRATPRDVVALGRSLSVIGGIQELIAERPAFASQETRLAALAAPLSALAERIVSRCVEAPPAHMREGGLFADGVDAELDEARLLQRDGNSWLAAYQKQLIEQTDIPSLKVGYNKVFGYYIEITHLHVAKIPDAFTRKQTLKNAERYITPELKEFEEKVTTAQTRAIEREKHLFEQLCKEIARATAELSAFGEVVSELDVLACFAEVAIRMRYVRPMMVDEPVLEIKQGRHPVLDRTLGDGFVPNDCMLNCDDAAGGRATLALITGPNMAGKSTYIRQVAIITLLAHTGCWVPAESAVIGLTDRIFTRIGSADELHAGQSTFMVEMTETANILHHATDRSLVILDEIGRGTSTLDGLALAWAIAESIAATRCRTLFATHYHELTSLSDRLDNVTSLHVSVREWGEEIIFLYRILPGRTDRSYGIHVAKIAGVPGETITRAEEVLETIEVQTDTARVLDTAPPPAPADGQLGLFTEYVEHPVVGALREVDLNTLTPIEAFDVLRKLLKRARGEAEE
jgi:DNA mismatch repair protein MutS